MPASNPPRVWLLLGKFAGDNAQVLALGRALDRTLGWPYTIKRVLRKPKQPLFGPDPLPTLAPGEAPLTEPWPDLVIGIGAYGARIGNWVKRQSGGRTRHVQMGRIGGAPYRHFDLILSTAQYELPPADRLIHLTLPIVQPDWQAMEAAAALWAPRWTDLPRPWFGVLVGGPSSPITFNRDDARRLLAQSMAAAHQSGGSLLVTSSQRTPAEVITELHAASHPRLSFYPFDRAKENPYPAMLMFCDRFIVTSDSVSMLADVSWTGRPIELFELPVREIRPGGNLRRRWRLRRRRRQLASMPPDIADRAYDTLVRNGWRRGRRYVPALIAQLKEIGWIRPLGSGRGPADLDRRACLEREMNQVIARIRSLMA